MKKISAILLSLIIAFSMMPMMAFAEDDDAARVYGPDEPQIENIEEYVLECEEYANAIFRDNPVFDCDQTLGREAEDYGVSQFCPTSVRFKMDADAHISLKSEYTGNLYLGVWKNEKDEQEGAKAVEVKRAVGNNDSKRSIDLTEIKNNDTYLLVMAICGDYGDDTVLPVNVCLELTAEPQGEDVGCVHVVTKVDKCEAWCGYDGWKTHYECQDCYEWMIKDKETKEFRPMTKAEKKKYTIKMPAKKHSFTKKVRNADTRIRKASCTKAAKYYYTCKHCGMIGNKTFTYGKKLGHKYKKNYIIPATTEKDGKIGTICTRCKKVKAKTKTTTIPRIDSMSFVAEPYVVPTDKMPTKFVVKNVKGKTINSKYYKVERALFFDVEFPKIPMDVDGDSIPESSLVLVTATFSGRYKGSVAGGYVETDETLHVIDDAWVEAVRKYIEENFSDTTSYDTQQ